MMRFKVYAKVQADEQERWFAYVRLCWGVWAPISETGYVGPTRQHAVAACEEYAELEHQMAKAVAAARIVRTTKPEILEL